MGRRTYTPEQIINKLIEVEVFISQGATAGEAIQNMNLMLGLPETTGLEALAIYP
ncbi:hypothetical protein ACFLWL_00850 [Chloroflexota bacterium]